MCRAIYMKKLTEGVNKNMFGLTLNYVVNSYNKRNNDGFFIKFGDSELRTMDYNQFIEFIVQNKELINESQEIMIHLRLATHGRGKECVHGWELRGYNCFHNGVIEIENKLIEDDSLDFFTEVTRDKKVLKNIKKAIKKRTGSGAFFMIGKNKSYIFSKRHDINIHLINKNIITINSNDDIHDFVEDIEIESEKPVDAFGLSFSGTKTTEIKTELDISEDLDLTTDNSLMIIKNNVVEKAIPLDIGAKKLGYGTEKSNGYGRYSHYGGYDDRDKDDEENIEKFWYQKYYQRNLDNY